MAFCRWRDGFLQVARWLLAGGEMALCKLRGDGGGLEKHGSNGSTPFLREKRTTADVVAKPSHHRLQASSERTRAAEWTLHARRMGAVPPVGHISSGGTAPAASLSVRPVVRPPPVASVPDELIAPPAVQYSN